MRGPPKRGYVLSTCLANKRPYNPQNQGFGPRIAEKAESKCLLRNEKQLVSGYHHEIRATPPAIPIRENNVPELALDNYSRGSA